MIRIARAESPEDVEAVRGLMREFTTWAVSLDPEANEDAPACEGLEEELAFLPGKFGPPDGCLLLARREGPPVGCVACFARGGGAVELKRMYVRPEARGQGAGSALVRALLDEARAAGAGRVVLDSFHTMTGGRRIYREAGFRDVEAPAGFPAALILKVVFMELDRLEAARAAGPQTATPTGQVTPVPPSPQ